MRSALQHAWATAVETVGLLVRQSLKASQGQDKWLRFFALTSTFLAGLEGTQQVPGTPATEKEIVEEVRVLVATLDLRSRLMSYGAALQEIETRAAPGRRRGAQYFLLILDPTEQRVSVTEYRGQDLEKATEDYLAAERLVSDRPGSDAVLVSVESIDTLRAAYPNYFLDTAAFLDAVSGLLEADPSGDQVEVGQAKPRS